MECQSLGLGQISSLHPSWVTRGKYVYVIILNFFWGGENKDHAVFLQGMRKQCWPPNDKNRHFQAWEMLRKPVDE